MKKIRTILVTGANSHLGQAIINRLEENVNNSIIAVSRILPPNIVQLAAVRYMTYDGLFNDRNINNIDIIINCAYPRREDANEENLQQTRVIAQTLMRQGIERWNSQLYLNMSCHSVYGEHRVVDVRETTPINVANLDVYAEHKLTTERLLEDIERVQNGIKLINLRLADMVGGNYSQPIIDNLIREALQNRTVTPSNTINRYAFIDIEDVTNAINRIITSDLNNFTNNAYNLGPIDTFTTQNIAEALNNSEVIRYLLTSIQENPSLNDEHNGIISHRMSSDALFDILRWRPEISLPMTLESRLLELNTNL